MYLGISPKIWILGHPSDWLDQKSGLGAGRTQPYGFASPVGDSGEQLHLGDTSMDLPLEFWNMALCAMRIRFVRTHCRDRNTTVGQEPELSHSGWVSSPHEVPEGERTQPEATGGRNLISWKAGSLFFSNPRKCGCQRLSTLTKSKSWV